MEDLQMDSNQNQRWREKEDSGWQLQQEVVRVRNMIKWSTPLTPDGYSSDTIDLVNRKMERKIITCGSQQKEVSETGQDCMRFRPQRRQEVHHRREPISNKRRCLECSTWKLPTQKVLLTMCK